METGRTFLKAALILLVFLVVADVIGVVVCTLIDVAPLRHKSSLLPYAIWLVLGIFTGLFAYNAAGAWASTKAEGTSATADPGLERASGRAPDRQPDRGGGRADPRRLGRAVLDALLEPGRGGRIFRPRQRAALDPVFRVGIRRHARRAHGIDAQPGKMIGIARLFMVSPAGFEPATY